MLSTSVSGSADLKTLFEAAKRPEVEPVVVQEEQPIKKTLTRGTRGGKKNKKALNSDDDEEEEEKKYTQPSRKFQVLAEKANKDKRDPAKEARTIFVGNLPFTVTPKVLKKHFRIFGKIDTVRLRGAARPDIKTTKKVAIIKRKFHEERTNIIAYVRFVSVDDAHKSLAMNGKEFKGKVLRVDMAQSELDKDDEKVVVERDQSKAVFVGNLSFKLEEDAVRSHFEKCGKIEDVRIVRDSNTGMGKGFCYVNFTDKNSVVLAMEMNGTELAGRQLRVNKSVRNPKTTTVVNNKKKFDSKKKIVKVNKKQIRDTFRGATFQKEREGNNKKKSRKPNKEEIRKKNVAKKLLRT